jgi:hypothetical protein
LWGISRAVNMAGKLRDCLWNYTENTARYRAIKKSLCPWWLQYKKHAKKFKQFQSLTMIT